MWPSRNVTAGFVYDGDNNRVKGTIGGVTSIYIGNYYEVAGSTVKKYDYAGNQRVAMKSGATLYWLLGNRDPTGRDGTAINVSGTTETGEVRYYPFGVDRYTSGSTPTSFKYTGQRQESGIGLYYYGARWYDPALGRFIQPDTVVPNPGDAKAFDRYAYSFNNPLLYSDPDGHRPCAVTSGKCTQSVQLNTHSADQLANRLSDLNVSWTNLAANVKSALQEQGIHEGIYSDLGPGATVQTGWRDPATLAATVYGGGRLAWRLPQLLYKLVTGACVDGDCTNEVSTATSSSQQLQNSARGLIGKDFENWLSKNLGGSGSFSVGGREFDGAVGNRWYEAKSGQFWDMLQNNSKAYNKFLSDMGSRLKIAQSNNAIYELHSNTPIPQQIKDWLTNKGIQYFEHLE